MSNLNEASCVSGIGVWSKDITLENLNQIKIAAQFRIESGSMLALKIFWKTLEMLENIIY